MIQEAIAFIGVLTLLSASLGSDVVLMLVVRPALERMGDSLPSGKAAGIIHLQVAKVMPMTSIGTIHCAGPVHVVSSFRLEQSCNHAIAE
ncbi:hypothetical protein KBY66_08085 [Synechococcus sp. Tobar12-5m-g]|uniref:hypothetical protein n=1 Tax=unclassified Synechococcus TaxID=2626047 RepID=UPI0020CE1302|nr:MULTISPECIES: hypothetical protein [unclassified Synechococcus]MCP9772585.1 hypothetical protein [Synechococcus sp. Tobar12-5m-g]MCP9873424.1 hypothetical protein [Synechococcus sp. Cruz CV-v-12]